MSGYWNKWVVNFKVLIMFVFGWLPIGLIVLILYIPAYVHEHATKLINRLGAEIIAYKIANDPPDLTKIMGKLLK